MVEGFGVFSSFQEYPCHGGEVVLQSVIAAGQKSGTQSGFEHLVLEFYGVPVFKSSGAFEYLDGSVFPVYLDDLGHESCAAAVDIAYLVLRDRSVRQDSDQVGYDTCDLSCTFHIISVFYCQLFHPQVS